MPHAEGAEEGRLESGSLYQSHTFMKILVTLSRVLKSEKQEIAAKDRFPYSSKKYFGGCIYTHVAELFL